MSARSPPIYLDIKSICQTRHHFGIPCLFVCLSCVNSVAHRRRTELLPHPFIAVSCSCFALLCPAALSHELCPHCWDLLWACSQHTGSHGLLPQPPPYITSFWFWYRQVICGNPHMAPLRKFDFSSVVAYVNWGFSISLWCYVILISHAVIYRKRFGFFLCPWCHFWFAVTLDWTRHCSTFLIFAFTFSDAGAHVSKTAKLIQSLIWA